MLFKFETAGSLQQKGFCMIKVVTALLCLGLNSFSFNYFPLQEGNYWVYTGSDTSGGFLKIKREIIDEILISSARAYIFTNSYFDSLGNLKTVSKDTLEQELLLQWNYGYLSLDTLIPGNRYQSDTSYHSADTLNGFTFSGKQYSHAIRITHIGDDYSDPDNAVNVCDIFIDSIGWIKRDVNSSKHPNLLSYSLTEWKTQFSEYTTSIKVSRLPDNSKQSHIMHAGTGIYHKSSLDLLGRTVSPSITSETKVNKAIISGQDRQKKIKILLH
jgi:hypothetical protein